MDIVLTRAIQVNHAWDFFANMLFRNSRHFSARLCTKFNSGLIFFCSVDNSDYMRNGDFVPTRLQAQQDAVNLVCHSKTRSNPENNVGLLAFTR